MERLIRPYISFEDVETEFRKIFDSGMFTKGEYSIEFPERLKAYTGAKHAFNATSATTALSACLEVLNVGIGDEVIVSDFSFPATVNVVEAVGARPVFADVSRDSYNMLPGELAKKITGKTKAVIFVCALGSPEGIEEIESLCGANNIPLIVDAACGIGSISNGRRVGNIGDFSCFSFHPRKLLTSGEGGAITTNSDEYAETLRIKLSHGSEVVDDKMVFSTYGYNYRLPELQCVMLIKQLEILDDIVKRRNAMQEAYAELLTLHGFVPQKHSEGVLNNYQSVVFTVPKGVNRDDLVVALRRNEVETTIGTYCQSACVYYANKYDDIQPNALWLEENTITLPCHDGVDAVDVATRIIELI